MNRNCKICGGMGFIRVSKWTKDPCSGKPMLMDGMERCVCHPEARGAEEEPAPPHDGRQAAAGRD